VQFWKIHYGNMHHHIPPSKTGWPSLNVVIFPPVMRLVLDDTKQWPPQILLIKFYELILEDRRISAKSIAEQLGISWASWVHHSWRFRHAETIREMGPEMRDRGSNTSTVPVVWANLKFFRRHPNDFLKGPCEVLHHKKIKLFLEYETPM
jgi:hypothetical protein